MNEIIRILMDRDDMEYEEACDELALMREALEDGQDPEEILYEYSLEPDYVMDLIGE